MGYSADAACEPNLLETLNCLSSGNRYSGCAKNFYLGRHPLHRHLVVTSGAETFCPFGLYTVISNDKTILLLGLPGLPREKLAKSPGLRHNDSNEPRWQLSTGNVYVLL